MIFLSVIGLRLTYLTCVYSTLKKQEGTQESNKVPVCTFVQALRWKAVQVLLSPRNDLGYFIRLGGFHTRMCFFGCIGYIMSNSGMRDALESIYAEITVPRLLSGIAAYRAIRWHQRVGTYYILSY